MAGKSRVKNKAQSVAGISRSRVMHVSAGFLLILGGIWSVIAGHLGDGGFLLACAIPHLFALSQAAYQD